MQALEIFQAVVVTATAATGAVVAVVGLKTWQKQLKGKTEYELARRLLRAVLEVRDEIAFVRGPFMSAAEISEAVKDVGENGEDLDPTSERAILAARWNRWKGLQEALTGLRMEELEAEVLWGSEMKGATEELRDCVRVLRASAMEYQDMFFGERPKDAEERERFVQLRRIMYGSGGERDDFNGQLEDAVATVEQALRPHLKL